MPCGTPQVRIAEILLIVSGHSEAGSPKRPAVASFEGQRFQVATPETVPSFQRADLDEENVLLPLTFANLPVPPVYSKVPLQPSVSPSHRHDRYASSPAPSLTMQ